MAKTTTRAERPRGPAAPPAYRGATTCDLRPDWAAADATLRALCEACHAADPDDLTPQLVLADRLADLADPRETWVRVGCALWAACGGLTAPQSAPGWDYEQARGTLRTLTGTVAGWRIVGLWGALVAWHVPAGDGSGPMGRTWADERVRVVNRCSWWWALALLTNNGAAGRQADAAGSQAYAAGSQADAAGRQADAAGRQAAVWRFARAAWELCAAKLPLLEAAG